MKQTRRIASVIATVAEVETESFPWHRSNRRRLAALIAALDEQGTAEPQLAIAR